MSGFDISQIDEIVHGRVRLGIMTYLSVIGTTDFSRIRVHLDVTDGNLSTHLLLCDVGRVALIAYLDAMRRLVDGSTG